jgi:SpoIID/LytB domain protein
LFRWEVTYRRQELEQLISEKTGQDIGELQDIIPLERGDSGRLIYIELIGSKKRMKIGKELEIRKVLSKSHLYSSCFYIEKTLDDRGKVEKFILKGGGWGHGVGLCQVGATVMAMKNIPYQKILNHYYKNTKLVRFYSFN